MAAMLAADAALASERVRAHVNFVCAASADQLREIEPSERGHKQQCRASV